MRISLTLTIALVAALTSPILADTVTPQRVLEFSPADGHGRPVALQRGRRPELRPGRSSIDSALGSNYDALVGAHVYLPTFQIGGIPGQPYTLTPLGNSADRDQERRQQRDLYDRHPGGRRPGHDRHRRRRLHRSSRPTSATCSSRTKARPSARRPWRSCRTCNCPRSTSTCPSRAAAGRATTASPTCSTAAASAPADSAARCRSPSRPRSFCWDSAAWRSFADAATDTDLKPPLP